MLIYYIIAQLPNLPDPPGQTTVMEYLFIVIVLSAIAVGTWVLKTFIELLKSGIDSLNNLTANIEKLNNKQVELAEKDSETADEMRKQTQAVLDNDREMINAIKEQTKLLVNMAKDRSIKDELTTVSGEININNKSIEILCRAFRNFIKRYKEEDWYESCDASLKRALGDDE